MSLVTTPARPVVTTAGRTRGARAERLVPPAALVATTAVVGAARVAGAALPTWLGPTVLLTGLLLGLPHGALDVDLLVRRTGRGHGRTAVAGLAYVAAAGAALACWYAVPTAALVGLLVLAVVHFGLTDLAGLHRRDDTRPVPVPAAAVLASGGLPVVLPFALHGARTTALLDRLSGGHAGAVLGLAHAALPVVVAAAVVSVGLGLTLDRTDLAVDVAVLGVAFAVLPPLIAFGVYFGLWHALRQTLALVADEAAARPVSSLARRAALPTLAALVLVLVLAVASRLSLTAGDLALLLAITVPHSAVSAWLDRAHLTGRVVGCAPSGGI